MMAKEGARKESIVPAGVHPRLLGQKWDGAVGMGKVNLHRS